MTDSSDDLLRLEVKYRMVINTGILTGNPCPFSREQINEYHGQREQINEYHGQRRKSAEFRPNTFNDIRMYVWRIFDDIDEYALCYDSKGYTLIPISPDVLKTIDNDNVLDYWLTHSCKGAASYTDTLYTMSDCHIMVFELEDDAIQFSLRFL